MRGGGSDRVSRDQPGGAWQADLSARAADSRNLANMRRICGGDPDGKLQLLLHYTGQTHDVADPWYTDDFDAAWRDIESGCRALLAQLKK